MSLVLSSTVYGNDLSHEDPALKEELFTVVVTASRIPQIITETPASVVVITREQLEETGAKNLGEALRTVSGVYIKDTGTFGSPASIFIRGSSSAQTLVLLDGRPINDARQGGIDASAISIHSIERIEIIKGAASALYGADAVSGVINIITAAGQGEPFHTLTIDVGEYGTRSLTLNGSGRSGLTGYSFAASSLSTDGFREHSSYEKLAFHLKLDHALSPSEQISMGIRHFSYDMEVPSSLTWPGGEGWREGKNISLDLQYNRILSLSSDLVLRAYYDNTHMYNIDNFGDSLHNGKRAGWDLQINTAPAGSQHLFTYGITGERDWVNSNKFAEPKERTNWGVYAQDLYSLTPRFDVVVSGRYDQYSSHGDSLCGRLGLNYLLGKRTKLYASWGNAFRAPTFNDLYWIGSENPNLKPELAQNYELGWQHWLNSDSNFSAAVFHRDVTDMLRWDPNVSKMVNIDKVRVQGIELDANYRLAAPLTARISYTYLDAVKNGNQPLDYTPSHKAQAGMTYTSELGFSGTVEALHVGERLDSFEGRPVAAYTVINLSLNQRLGSDWQLHCRIGNVLDTKYEDSAGYPAPPRMINVGVSYSF
ncbi:MAG TPA: TonB-dependent receptor [Firmicutes bacterium]|nr:TonB-dependent receptor [Bacillota bacterium]